MVGYEVYQELLGVFLCQLPPFIAELRNAAAIGDVPAARNVAHQIKGAALSFDAVHLDEIADQLLRIGPDNCDSLGSLVADTIREIGRLQLILDHSCR